VRYTTQTVANTSDSTTDNLVDSPTLYGHDFGNGGEVVGNYCTLNPLRKKGVLSNSSPTPGETSGTFSNGNLSFTGNNLEASGDIVLTTGKWYYEGTLNTSSGSGTGFGWVADLSADATGPGTNTNGYGVVYRNSTTGVMYGAGGSGSGRGDTSLSWATFTVGDIIGCAINVDANICYFYKNGVLQGSYSLPTGQSWAAYTEVRLTSESVTFNFGQRPWQYTPPAGFSALTTKNLPRATNAAAITPNQHFAVTSWTGTGATQNISLNFQPDLIWCKRLDSSANYPIIQNTITGITYSSGTNASDQPGNYSAVAAG
jgi:hypothetical protein